MTVRFLLLKHIDIIFILVPVKSIVLILIIHVFNKSALVHLQNEIRYAFSYKGITNFDKNRFCFSVDSSILDLCLCIFNLLINLIDEIVDCFRGCILFASKLFPFPESSKYFGVNDHGFNFLRNYISVKFRDWSADDQDVKEGIAV